MLKTKTGGRSTTASEETLHLLHDVVEDLAPRFTREFPRSVIRRCAAEVIVDLRDAVKLGELRDVADLVTTYRLTSLIDVPDEGPTSGLQDNVRLEVA